MTKGSVKPRLRATGRRLVEAIAPTAMRSISEVPRLEREIRELRAELNSMRPRIRDLRADLNALGPRIAELRAEIAETRRLHQRVAELTDVVAEVLVPVADRDDARVQKALETFARTSF